MDNWWRGTRDRGGEERTKEWIEMKVCMVSLRKARFPVIMLHILKLYLFPWIRDTNWWTTRG